MSISDYIDGFEKGNQAMLDFLEETAGVIPSNELKEEFKKWLDK